MSHVLAPLGHDDDDVCEHQVAYHARRVLAMIRVAFRSEQRERERARERERETERERERAREG